MTYPKPDLKPSTELKSKPDLRSKPELKVITDPSDLHRLLQIRFSQWFPHFTFQQFLQGIDVEKSNYGPDAEKARNGPGAAGTSHGCSYLDKYPITNFALVDKSSRTANGESGIVDKREIRNAELKVLSSCGIFKRPSIIKLLDQEPVESFAYTVIAVVTPPECRGKGYAGEMMEKVVGYIDEVQGIKNKVDINRNDDKGSLTFSHLYSDVGEYYSQFGYKTSAQANELYIDLTKQRSKPFTDPVPLASSSVYDGAAAEPLPYTLLTPSDFDAFAALDKQQVLHDIDQLTQKDKVPRVAIAPCAEFSRFYQALSVHAGLCLFPEKFEDDGVGKAHKEGTAIFKTFDGSSADKGSKTDKDPSKDNTEATPDSGRPFTRDHFNNAAQKFTYGATCGPVSALWTVDFRKQKVAVYRTIVSEEARQTLAEWATKNEEYDRMMSEWEKEDNLDDSMPVEMEKDEWLKMDTWLGRRDALYRQKHPEFAQLEHEITRLRAHIVKAYGILLNAAAEEGLKWNVKHLALWQGDLPHLIGQIQVGLYGLERQVRKEYGWDAHVRVKSLDVPMIRYSGSVLDNSNGGTAFDTSDNTSTLRPEPEWFTPGQYAWH